MKKWIRIILPKDLSVEEAREWCEENCLDRFRVRKPKSKFEWGWRTPFASFQNEIDAMAFRLRWL